MVVRPKSLRCGLYVSHGFWLRLRVNAVIGSRVYGYEAGDGRWRWLVKTGDDVDDMESCVLTV